MAVKIRLKRMGKKKAPHYRIVVADSRSPRDGRFIEEIGIYDPNQEPSLIKVDEEAAKKWLGTGAQPTDVVARLFGEIGITEKVVKVGPPKKAKEESAKEEPAKEEAPAEDVAAEAEEAAEAAAADKATDATEANEEAAETAEANEEVAEAE